MSASTSCAGCTAAGVGLAVVVANFLLAGALLSRSARISLSLYHAAALFGFFLRLGLITLTMVLLTQLTEIDRLVMERLSPFFGYGSDPEPGQSQA